MLIGEKSEVIDPSYLFVRSVICKITLKVDRDNQNEENKYMGGWIYAKGVPIHS